MAIKPSLRVFLDSNVIFSGIYSANGAPGKIIDLFVRGEYVVVISQLVLGEVVRAFRDFKPEALQELNIFLSNSPPEIVSGPELEDIAFLREILALGDALILGAAIAAKPDYFVTGDNRFLKNPVILKEAGIKIVTPAQFLMIIGQGGMNG